MRIDRCICFGRSFGELLETARSGRIAEVSELQERVPFGLNCGLCLPYVRRSLRTGEIVFHHVLTDDDGPDEP